MAKYMNEGSMEALLESLEECNSASMRYKEAWYEYYVDGLGFNIAMVEFKGKGTTREQYDESHMRADTIEELLEKYVMYDGVTMPEVLQMDASEYR